VRHALTNQHHPQHRQLVAAVAKLHERWAERPDAGETPTTLACAEALAQADAKRDQLAADCDDEIEKLEALGYDASAPIRDPQPWQLTLLQAQRLHAENDVAALEPLLARELVALQAPADLRQQLTAVTHDPDVLPETRDAVLHRTIDWIARTRQHRHGHRRF